MSNSVRDKVDISITDYLYDNYNFDIKSSIDVRKIIQAYRDRLLEISEDEIQKESKLNVLNLDIPYGFMHIYGAPDTGKTLIARELANVLNSQGKKVAYIDADNKLNRGDINDGILYIIGRTNTYNLVKKLVATNTVDIIIIDTIFSLSRSEDFVRSSVKYIRNLSMSCIMFNQTRFHRYGQYPAGSDVITHNSRINLRIISSKKIGKRLVISLDNGIRFVYLTGDEGIPIKYLPEETSLSMALSNGVVIKIGKLYVYKEKQYSKKEIQRIIYETPRGYTSKVSKEKILSKGNI